MFVGLNVDIIPSLFFYYDLIFEVPFILYIEKYCRTVQKLRYSYSHLVSELEMKLNSSQNERKSQQRALSYQSASGKSRNIQSHE